MYYRNTEMNEISDIEKQNILLRKKVEELSRKVSAMKQEIALLNHENRRKNRPLFEIYLKYI